MIPGIAHIGIAVRSIAEGRRFYEALGLAVESIEEVPSEKVRVAFIPCGETRIELLEATAPDSPIAKFLDKRGPGIHHLCFASTDVPGDAARLAAAGVELLHANAARGVQFIHPRSAGGVLVELSEGRHE
jgi:methylmalonyl-CoA/ethylmalonyl-CoA epimerase